MNLNCPACNQAANVDAPSADGLLHCPRCGLALARPAQVGVLGKLAIKRVPASELTEEPIMIGTKVEEEPPLAVPAPPRPRFQRAIIAEDLELHRQLISDGLKQHKLVGAVAAVGRGDRLVTVVTEAFLRKQPPDLCILDLEMPGLSGYHAAVALRAVERAFGAPQTPVLFFSARVCDELFRRAMDEVGNATYLNKASDGGPEQMFERLAQVLRTFSGEPALEADLGDLI